jgi:hypothetical protein
VMTVSSNKATMTIRVTKELGIKCLILWVGSSKQKQ